MLYPIKFHPIFKEKVWGGNKLHSILKKEIKSDKTGESWEISCVPNNLSVVSNGNLRGATIQELIETYKQNLVGEKVYKVFGNVFPLLIKFIDASDDLSIQVHPDDNFAKKRHKENGKNEMWYIVDADDNTDIIVGVNNDFTKKEYLEVVKENNLKSILNYEKIKKGDVFYIPAGRIHAIMKGTLLAEIQQNSDLTYRIFDWNRKDLKGNYRELHTKLASDVVELKKQDDYFIKYNNQKQNENLVSNNYFTINYMNIDKAVKKDLSKNDSFFIYMCTKGALTIDYKGEKFNLGMGETILIPASIKQISLLPKSKSELLEVYI